MGSDVYDKNWIMKEFNATEKKVDKWMADGLLLHTVRQGKIVVFSKRQIKRLWRLLGNMDKPRPKKLKFPIHSKLKPLLIEAPKEAKTAIQDAIVKESKKK